MNLPEIKSYEEQAIDTVVYIINRAKEKLGIRLHLRELARSREEFLNKWKVSLNSLRNPLVKTSEKLIASTIERVWKLTPTFMYNLKYVGSSQHESSQFYYYEAVFSQPTAAYPIPQATVSVFFKVEDKHIEPPEVAGVPCVTFRIEGQNTDHDVRFVLLTADWILAVIKMKTNVFKRIEQLNIF